MNKVFILTGRKEKKEEKKKERKGLKQAEEFFNLIPKLNKV